MPARGFLWLLLAFWSSPTGLGSHLVACCILVLDTVLAGLGLNVDNANLLGAWGIQQVHLEAEYFLLLLSSPACSKGELQGCARPSNIELRREWGEGWARCCNYHANRPTLVMTHFRRLTWLIITIVGHSLWFRLVYGELTDSGVKRARHVGSFFFRIVSSGIF